MSKEIFAETINMLGSHANLSANECEIFGMTWGCQFDCPVFERGECKDCFFENLKIFIEKKEYCKESAVNQINIYKKKLTTEQYNHLIALSDCL